MERLPLEVHDLMYVIDIATFILIHIPPGNRRFSCLKVEQPMAGVTAKPGTSRSLRLDDFFNQSAKPLNQSDQVPLQCPPK